MRLSWLIIFLLLAVSAGALFTVALRKKIAIIKLGAPENRIENVRQRINIFIANILGHKKMINEPYGVVHLFLFWGFIFVAISDMPFILGGIFPDFQVPFLGTNPYFYFIKDVLAILVVAGLFVGLVRRWIIRPPQLYRTFEAALVVVLVLLVIITEWLSSGARYALQPNLAAFALDPAYNFVANVLFNKLSVGTLITISDTAWWCHVAILLTFLVYIPNSKHLHLLAAPFNGYFASLKPIGGQVNPLDVEDENLTEFGVGRIEGFTWKQMLDCYACGECGRCMDNCPASLSGKPLNPKELISRTLKHHLIEKGEVMLANNIRSTGEENGEELAKLAEKDPKAAEVLAKNLITDVVTEDVIWSCTTCMSCQVQCPVSNEHVNKIIDMRRHQVLMESSFAPELQTTFRNVENNYNPWGVSWNERADWAQGLDVKIMSEAENPEEVEYLFWVGCAGSLDARARKVSVAIATILKAAGINFAILGTEEKCCGDFLRRTGNEYLYQSLAGENIEALNRYKVKKIITACPHCLNTLRNEYPDFGGKYEVIHHTQLINQLLAQGKIQLRKDVPVESKRIVYHDSCYLGRYQQEYSAPRELFGKIPGVQLVEMDRNHDKSFCCGAGGGRMWMEEHLGERINNMRVEQALTKKPQAIGANCPYCITMLEDGVKDVMDAEEAVSVVDPAELVAKMI